MLSGRDRIYILGECDSRIIAVVGHYGEWELLYFNGKNTGAALLSSRDLTY